jgi:F-type H+-transporting ATPase subunit alpha
MQIRPEEIASVLRKEIESFDYSLEMAEVGTVLEVGDGIARIYGLENVMANEMIQFENGSFGMAFNLEEDSVGAVILGDYLEREGGQMSSSAPGRLLEVPVGEALLGSRRDPARRADRRAGPDRHEGVAEGGHHRAGHRRPPAGARAAADGHQGDRRDDPDRPRPA